MPTHEDIHTAFEQGEVVVMALFQEMAIEVAALVQQLTKQGEVLQELQARLAKSSRNRRKPPWRGHEAMEDAGLLGAFTGTAMQDH
ncbi:MAG TPA: hypothetical protein VI542_01610 [Candidatus Tectomicrobia bacterium]